MYRRCASWQRGIGAVVLVGGLLLGGSGVASAASPTAEEILAKLNEVLTAVGNIKEGNHTLRWDQNLPAAQRFVILPAFNNEAVLDKNTGLVWEKSPGTLQLSWGLVRAICANKTVGGQRGWRLPSFAEQASLIDPSVPSPGPKLPPGHPFLNVQSNDYWSATTYAEQADVAFSVSFTGEGSVASGFKTINNYVWCVRGGMNADQY